MKNLDLEKLDAEYIIEKVNPKLYTIMKKSRNILGFDDNLSISKVLEEVKNKNLSVEFGVRNSESATLEEFIVAARLNEEVKTITTAYDVLIFGNLDHFVSKEPISFPEDFKDLSFASVAGKAVAVANQTLFLAPVEPEYKDLVSYWRANLVHMLKYGRLPEMVLS